MELGCQIRFCEYLIRNAKYNQKHIFRYRQYTVASDGLPEQRSRHSLFACQRYECRHLIPFLNHMASRLHISAGDLPGHGLSGPPTVNPLKSLHTFIPDVQKLLTRHFEPPIHFVGHSLGGGLSHSRSISRTYQTPGDDRSPGLFSPIQTNDTPIDQKARIGRPNPYHQSRPTA